jgi:hypothetical protein
LKSNLKLKLKGNAILHKTWAVVETKWDVVMKKKRNRIPLKI